MLNTLAAHLMPVLALMPDWLSPESILRDYGFWAVLSIIFAETGLLVGFFLPGDTLLFSAGVFSHPDIHTIKEPFWLLVVFTPVAATVGNMLGYAIGHSFGPRLFQKEDSFIFRKHRLEKSHNFFEKHGPIAVFLARFVPVVRTFLPVVAGAAGMDKRKFFIWTVLGGIAWTSGILLLGYMVVELLPRSTVDWIQGKLDILIIGVVLFVVVGLILEPLIMKMRGGHGEKSESSDDKDAG